ncbi:hypothetical protein [Flavobacterium sp. FlaQc-50]|jgi:hypothetical protein|uniref:hypothetical protein n=1 Tax=unclassified Flavobacterium TaxID=196869 RepID=UPI003757F4EB
MKRAIYKLLSKWSAIIKNEKQKKETTRFLFRYDFIKDLVVKALLFIQYLSCNVRTSNAVKNKR